MEVIYPPSAAAFSSADWIPITETLIQAKRKCDAQKILDTQENNLSCSTRLLAILHWVRGYLARRASKKPCLF